MDLTDFFRHPKTTKTTKDSEKLKDAIEASGKSCSQTTKFPPFFGYTTEYATNNMYVIS